MNIGITGRPGSGKTTLAYYLTQLLPNSYLPDVDMIYHLRAHDKMMDGIGWRYVTAGTNKEEANKAYEYILESCKEKGIEIQGDFSLKEKASYALSNLTFKYTEECLGRDIPKNCDFIIIDFYLLPYLNKFFELDYSVFLDVDTSIRFNHALERMSKNEGKQFSEEEKKERIRKMEEFENKENVNYQLINYDLVLKNPPSLLILQEEAKRLALEMLEKYSKEEKQNMLLREYEYGIEQVVDSCDSTAYKKYAYEGLKKYFGTIAVNKLMFLYEENLIDKEMFSLFLEKKMYAVKYYLNSSRKLLRFEEKLNELSLVLKEDVTSFYNKNLIDKDTYSTFIKECKKLKKALR